MTFFGRLVRKDVKVEHCVDGLPRGIYIVGKKKNTCRQVECQNDKVKDSDARECVISCRIPYGWEITHSRVLSFFLKVSVSLLLLSLMLHILFSCYIHFLQNGTHPVLFRRQMKKLYLSHLHHNQVVACVSVAKIITSFYI